MNAGRRSPLTAELRALGVRAETDLVGRSLKAQMKYADKLGAQNTIVLGTDELSAGECTAAAYGDRREEAHPALRAVDCRKPVIFLWIGSVYIWLKLSVLSSGRTTAAS